MFQGTGSGVGKSTLIAGLARLLTRRGLRVRPFQPEAVSSRIVSTVGGGGSEREIAYAQALQAVACAVPPDADMTPVLLTPQEERAMRVAGRGLAPQRMSVADYLALRTSLLPGVLDAFHRLATQADIILVEGAGGAADRVFANNDIGGMGFAQAADLDVVLVGEGHSGGVIASLVGTQTLLPHREAARIKAFIINHFGNMADIMPRGMDSICALTGWPSLGGVPTLAPARALQSYSVAEHRDPSPLRIAVPILPMATQIDDVAPLAAEPGVMLEHVRTGSPIPPCDLIILPASRAVIADLATLRQEAWDVDIIAHARRGGRVLGLCGGYHMLGKTVADPYGMEGPPSTVPGLGLLDVATILRRAKTQDAAEGTLFPNHEHVTGLEVHMGLTSGPSCHHPFLRLGGSLAGQNEGATALDGRVAGTCLHGLFSSGTARAALLRRYRGNHCDWTQDALARAQLGSGPINLLNWARRCDSQTYRWR